MRKRIAVFAVLAALTFAPAALGGDGGRGVALCVGIGGDAARDAETVAAALTENTRFRRVVTLTDAGGEGAATDRKRLPTRENLLSVLALISRAAGANEEVFLYISGRGRVHEGELQLSGLPGDVAETGVGELAGALEGGGSGPRVAVLDVVVEGGDGAVDRQAWRAGDSGMAIIAFCVPERMEKETGGERRGLLAAGLTEALSGLADADADGSLSGGEMFEYVRRGVTDYYLEHLILDQAAPEMSDGGHEARAATLVAKAPPAAAPEPVAEAPVAKAAAPTPEAAAPAIETAAAEIVANEETAAPEPQYYTDAATGRVFVYDEEKGDWVIHTEPNTPQYTQSAPSRQQYQEQYYDDQYRQRRGGYQSSGRGMDTAVNVLGTVASFLFR